ncbi:glycosyl hydrolase family 28-related protein [Cerasicoccus maritimus]|uniref:glycosyl hydrolase family 28-related protein n=1 Tax=Cerasicoccus maritimus TaxID=490089 RepID=UPI002852543C|nr:glycosyl hydrolase family 28-related protein [Cerasicoccus maritimus]
MKSIFVCLPLSVLCLSLTSINAQEYSDLWGVDGEKWATHDRLPDFSYAGYAFGEAPIPDFEVVANVKDFGATGDGQTDDTKAFIDAIESTENGALFVPEGRYVISDILWIKKPNFVMRGEGPDKTTLFLNKPLQEIKPHASKRANGEPVSEYSWSGGFLWMKGRYLETFITNISQSSKRGERTLTVENGNALKPGQVIMIEQRELNPSSLLKHVYSGDTGNVKAIKKVRVPMLARIASIDGNQVTLDRNLRYDIQPQWSPRILIFSSSLYNSGIESLTCEFPNTPYLGHFSEQGWNAIEIAAAMNCWVKDVAIINADSGIFIGGYNVTIEGVLFTSDRDSHLGFTGHHAITVGRDCLVQNFDIQTRFIHDITMSAFAAGNVIKGGKGIDLTLDHHRRGPNHNLFTNLDLGAGTNPWLSGGGLGLGKHTAGNSVFWNLKSDFPVNMPAPGFGPATLAFVGFHSSDPTQKDPGSRWVETIWPDNLQPVDLHQAQLEKRLSQEAPEK